MPFSLGFWATAGATSGGGAAMELISTTILGSTSSTISFTSVPQTYKHLELRITAAVNANIQSSTTIRFRFNADTGLSSKYAYHHLYGNGSSVPSDSTTSQSGAVLNGFGDTSVANIWGAGVISILDYTNTSKYKTLRGLIGTVNTTYYKRIGLASGLWQDTAAITDVTLTEPNGYGWIAGSRFSLYGIKG